MVFRRVSYDSLQRNSMGIATTSLRTGLAMTVLLEICNDRLRESHQMDCHSEERSDVGIRKAEVIGNSEE